MKKVTAIVKLQIPAGKATPAPPVGTALGPQGVNIMEFCKAFNAGTQALGDSIIPVVISIYQDRSFSLAFKSPPASFLIRKAAGLEKGAQTPGKGDVGKITWQQCLEIARQKQQDLNAATPEAAARIIAGTARSMGVAVEGAPS